MEDILLEVKVKTTANDRYGVYHCYPLKEFLDPSVQSDSNLTIVDQLIVLGATVGSYWVE